MINVKAFRFDQEPMQTGDLNSMHSSQVANAFALSPGNIRYGIRESERRDFDCVIADLRAISEDVFDLPIAEDFVADGELHYGAD